MLLPSLYSAKKSALMVPKTLAILALSFLLFSSVTNDTFAVGCTNFSIDSCVGKGTGDSCQTSRVSNGVCIDTANLGPMDDAGNVLCSCEDIAYIPESQALTSSPTNCTPGAESLNLLDCFALNSKQTVSQVYTSPAVLINLLVNLLFIIGGMILFLIILYAGFLFITGDVKGKDKAQEMIGSAVIGFIVMFSAYWILQIIQTVTGANLM